MSGSRPLIRAGQAMGHSTCLAHTVAGAHKKSLSENQKKKCECHNKEASLDYIFIIPTVIVGGGDLKAEVHAATKARKQP